MKFHALLVFSTIVIGLAANLRRRNGPVDHSPALKPSEVAKTGQMPTASEDAPPGVVPHVGDGEEPDYQRQGDPSEVAASEHTSQVSVGDSPVVKKAQAGWQAARTAVKEMYTDGERTPLRPNFTQARRPMNKEKFQKISDKRMYCWRFGAAQALGVPRGTIEEAMSAAGKDPKAGDLLKALADTGDAGVGYRKGSTNGEVAAGDTERVLEQLKEFVKGGGTTLLSDEKQNEELVNAINCLKVAPVTWEIDYSAAAVKKAKKKVKELLGGSESARVIVSTRGHVRVALLGSGGKLKIADANGSAEDEKMVPFDDLMGSDAVRAGEKVWFTRTDWNLSCGAGTQVPYTYPKDGTPIP